MTDKELISLLLNNKTREKGFSLLAHTYKEKIYWQVRHMVLSHEDANDLTQDIFIKIFQNIDSFNHDSSLSTWIYRISLNHTLNFLQSKSQKHKSSLKTLEDTMLDNLKSDKYFDSSEIKATKSNPLASRKTKISLLTSLLR